MSYSIISVLHPHENKEHLHKVNIQVIYNRMKTYLPTPVKVKKEYFDKGAITGGTHKKENNAILRQYSHDIETRLLELLRRGQYPSKSDFDAAVKGASEKNTQSVEQFVEQIAVQYKGKLSKGRLNHYVAISNKIQDFHKGVTFGDIDVQWMNKFETWLRNQDLGSNTILSNMSLLISILNKAKVANLINESQFKEYKRPTYQQKLVEYLTEEQLDKFKRFIDVSELPGIKQAGYYFLFSSLTGYRISDARRFKYDEMIKDGQIVIRAGKNGRIVSIPIYPRLQEILDLIKQHPLKITDQEVNRVLKEIAPHCGIKFNLHFHISRHSFSMWMISKGFSIDEVAQLLGDSSEIARVYAHISNPHLSKKILDRLG